MILDLSFPYLDAWWAGRATTPEFMVDGIDRTLKHIAEFDRSAKIWEVANPDRNWPTSYAEKLALVESRVTMSDPDDNGHVEPLPEFGYTMSMFPLSKPAGSARIQSVSFWTGSTTPAISTIVNRVSIKNLDLKHDAEMRCIFELFEPLGSIWRPDFISLSTDGTRELVDASFTSPRPGLMMWFSDRLPCAPGVESLGYPRLGEGVLVDLRSLVEDSDDPVASLTKVYAQLENVGAFDPIPPMSPLEH